MQFFLYTLHRSRHEVTLTSIFQIEVFIFNYTILYIMYIVENNKALALKKTLKCVETWAIIFHIVLKNFKYLKIKATFYTVSE